MNWVSVIVAEGKFRQVRKMTAATGFPTLRLVRVGSIRLNDMAPGEAREVSEFGLAPAVKADQSAEFFSPLHPDEERTLSR
jgi:23S rRNA pseudouridine2457 synthase